MEGDYPGARETLAGAVEAWVTLGDIHGEAEAVRARGRVSMFAGQTVAAEAELAEALALYREAGDRRGEAWSLQNLATISFFKGDAAKAEERLGRAEVTFRELGDFGGLNWTFAVLAWVRFMQGNREEAERLALEQLPESETTGNRWVTAILQMLLGNIALWSGRVRRSPSNGASAAINAIARAQRSVGHQSGHRGADPRVGCGGTGRRRDHGGRRADRGTRPHHGGSHRRLRSHDAGPGARGRWHTRCPSGRTARRSQSRTGAQRTVPVRAAACVSASRAASNGAGATKPSLSSNR